MFQIIRALLVGAMFVWGLSSAGTAAAPVRTVVVAASVDFLVDVGARLHDKFCVTRGRFG